MGRPTHCLSAPLAAGLARPGQYADSNSPGGSLRLAVIRAEYSATTVPNDSMSGEGAGTVALAKVRQRRRRVVRPSFGDLWRNAVHSWMLGQPIRRQRSSSESSVSRIKLFLLQPLTS